MARSDPVTVEVTAPPVPPEIPWWVIAAGLTGVLVVGGVIAYEVLRPK
jgi:cytochrome bd-type quinol oxidase subunit 1